MNQNKKIKKKINILKSKLNKNKKQIQKYKKNKEEIQKYIKKKKKFKKKINILKSRLNSNDKAFNIIENTHPVLQINHEKLENIHSMLQLNHGSFYEELPEQKMVVNYLKGEEKVLEIGGNIGRNSLIIASILKNDKNLLVLESDSNISQQLTENKNLNKMNFHIENAALSKRKLIQYYWDTKPSEILEEGYSWVNTITLEQLRNKYRIKFDTLILDCEGAFYYILLDMPEILDNIKLIIMENDYHIFEHKIYIDNVLKNNNFYVDYSEVGGWGHFTNNFFEVWKKNTN